MTTERHLARSRNGKVIHRDDCRHARFPWHWADKVSADEVLDAKLRMGYRLCRVCWPLLFDLDEGGLSVRAGRRES